MQHTQPGVTVPAGPLLYSVHEAAAWNVCLATRSETLMSQPGNAAVNPGSEAANTHLSLVSSGLFWS